MGQSGQFGKLMAGVLGTRVGKLVAIGIGIKSIIPDTFIFGETMGGIQNGEKGISGHLIGTILNTELGSFETTRGLHND